MNMSTGVVEKKTSDILSVLGNPFRLRVLLALEDQEACVCHLEGLLGKRQAYISQHLMVLREAGLLETRRVGKYIYYRLASPDVLELVRAAGTLAGINPEDLSAHQDPAARAICECPNCCDEQPWDK